MRKRIIVLVVTAGLLVIGCVALRFVDFSPAVSVAVLGTTNINGDLRLLIAVTNGGRQSIYCPGGFTVRPATGFMTTVSTAPIRIPAHSSVLISDVPTSLCDSKYSIWAHWEVSWRWKVDQWTKSMGFIPKRVRNWVPKYSWAKSPEYEP